LPPTLRATRLIIVAEVLTTGKNSEFGSVKRAAREVSESVRPAFPSTSR
jgi:hypothetical protein